MFIIDLSLIILIVWMFYYGGDLGFLGKFGIFCNIKIYKNIIWMVFNGYIFYFEEFYEIWKLLIIYVL